ncbi:hypothetical protein EVAR_29650_1 [Eumeta japonica]|uniref:Uncharacterized protein n=1 Tax=Eumeta variegata TaxID=151549 RepID=A0A4C1WA74_EUMVA|nr:hypothetical protein EVAR_29650_1 [Eumeta japonica]
MTVRDCGTADATPAPPITGGCHEADATPGHVKNTPTLTGSKDRGKRTTAFVSRVNPKSRAVSNAMENVMLPHSRSRDSVVHRSHVGR